MSSLRRAYRDVVYNLASEVDQMISDKLAVNQIKTTSLGDSFIQDLQENLRDQEFMIDLKILTHHEGGAETIMLSSRDARVISEYLGIDRLKEAWAEFLS